MVEMTRAQKPRYKIRPGVYINIKVWNAFTAVHKSTEERSIIIEKLLELQTEKRLIKIKY